MQRRISSADGSQRMLNAIELGMVIMEVKGGAYEPIGPGGCVGVGGTLLLRGSALMSRFVLGR